MIIFEVMTDKPSHIVGFHLYTRPIRRDCENLFSFAMHALTGQHPPFYFRWVLTHSVDTQCKHLPSIWHVSTLCVETYQIMHTALEGVDTFHLSSSCSPTGAETAWGRDPHLGGVAQYWLNFPIQYVYS